MGLLKIILPGKMLALASVLSVSLSAPSTFASKTDINLFTKDESATKLEIITLVKKKHPGRILSVRKKYKASDNNCHTVKLIDVKGELLDIKVNCI